MDRHPKLGRGLARHGEGLLLSHRPATDVMQLNDDPAGVRADRDAVLGAERPVQLVIHGGGDRRAAGLERQHLESVAEIEIALEDGPDRVEARPRQHHQAGTGSRLVGDADPHAAIDRVLGHQRRRGREQQAGHEHPVHEPACGVKKKLTGSTSAS